MAIEIKQIRRQFRYNGVALADLPDMSIDEIRKLHSMQFPELLNADVEMGEIVDGEQEIVFRRTVGTKQ